MPKNTPARIIDERTRTGAGFIGGGGSGGGGVTDHGALSGLADDDHLQYHTDARGDARYMPLTANVTAGAGLTSSGALSTGLTLNVGAGAGLTVNADDVALASSVAGAALSYTAGVLAVVPGEGLEIETDAIGLKASVAGAGLAYNAGVIAVGQGAGLTINADDVALTTPGTLTVTSANSATGNHTHAIASSADPDASASLLATTAAGLLTLRNGAFRQAAQSYAVFASGFAGSGWRVDYGITTANRASAEFDDLTVRGRMRVYELLIQQIRATNGSLFVTSGSKIVSVTVGSNAWTVNGAALTFNGQSATFNASFYTINTAAAGDYSRSLYHGFLYGDLPVAQQMQWNGTQFTGVMVSKLEVTRVDSLTQYGAVLVEGDAPAAGYDYVRRGNTVDPSRRGAIYLTSDDAAAPFIDIVDGLQYHSDWGSASLKRTRLGKLTGISDVDFGGPLSGYGIYTDNGYFKGKIIVTGGNAATTNYVDSGLSAKASTAYVDAVAALKASIGYVDSSLAAAVAPLAAITYVDDRTTHIDGGSITTGTINANRIGAVNLAVLQAAVGTLSALSANLGTVTAGSLVIGSTNKLWLNDSADGSLRIGGTVKTAAPFQVSAAGYLTAEDATIGDFSVLDGDAFITAPTAYNLATKGYKFRSSTGVLVGGLTAFLPSGVGGVYLDNNFSSDIGSTPVQSRNATTAVRALGATGYVSVVDLYARHQSTGLDSGLHVVNDPSQSAGSQRRVELIGDKATFNGSVIWHAGNDGGGSGLDADTLDGYDGSSYAQRANPYFTANIYLASSAGGTTANGHAATWLTADKRFVIAYYDGTNTKYRWMNLTSTDAAWNYQLNGTPPA